MHACDACRGVYHVKCLYLGTDMAWEGFKNSFFHRNIKNNIPNTLFCAGHGRNGSGR